MNWPSPGAIGASILFCIAVAYAVSVEIKITRGIIPLVGYSFKQPLCFGIVVVVISVLLSFVIYWWTGDSDLAKTWLVIMLALCVVGVLKGLLAEYHHKKRGGPNMDKSSS